MHLIFKTQLTVVSYQINDAKLGLILKGNSFQLFRSSHKLCVIKQMCNLTYLELNSCCRKERCGCDDLRLAYILLDQIFSKKNMWMVYLYKRYYLKLVYTVILVFRTYLINCFVRLFQSSFIKNGLDVPFKRFISILECKWFNNTK